jgi:hypothetical protein
VQSWTEEKAADCPLCKRGGRTGSTGVGFDAVLRRASAAGIESFAVALARGVARLEIVEPLAYRSFHVG